MLPSLKVVWGTSSAEVFVAGYKGFVARRSGGTWTVLPTGTTGAISDLWGSSGRDVWAAAENAVLHYDGVSWTSTPFPNEYLRAIWGSAPGDVWVGGEKGLRHWDGTSWTPVPKVGRAVMSLWGSRAADVFVVGAGQIQHFDGASWTPVDRPSPPRSTTFSGNLARVWGSPRPPGGPAHGTDVWFAGDGGVLFHLSTAFPTQEGGECDQG